MLNSEKLKFFVSEEKSFVGMASEVFSRILIIKTLFSEPIEDVRVPDAVLKSFLVIINVPFLNRSLEFCEWNEVYDVTPKHSNHSLLHPSNATMVKNNGRDFRRKKLIRVSAFKNIDIYVNAVEFKKIDFQINMYVKGVEK